MTKRKRYEDDDDDNVLRTLKDGERMHFSMMAMDSGGEVLPGRDTVDATAPLHVVDAFGNSGLALNKPGARYLTAGKHTPDHAALLMHDHQRREARDEYVQQLCDAWKGTAPTTVKLRACTIPATPAPTPIWTRNMILKILGIAAVASAAKTARPLARCTMLSRASASRTRPTPRWSTNW